MEGNELILRSSTYAQIVATFKGWVGDLKKLEEWICETYNIPVKTATSIVSINFVRRIKGSHFRTSSQSKAIWATYENEVAQGRPLGIILRVANHMGTSSALLSKIILDHYLKNMHNTSPKKNQVDKDILEDIRDHSGGKIPGEGRNTSSRMLRDTSLVPDGRLAAEILLCNIHDEQYGHLSEMYNRGIGEEFENILDFKARECGLSYEAEEDLRSHGYDKTPDLKLNVPVAVDGFVVNWIESKGLFGDEAGHRTYISEQYASYWNRFGSGMVIYWLGYEESIADPHEKRFIVRGGFPKNITLMDPLSIPVSSSSSQLNSSLIS